MAADCPLGGTSNVRRERINLELLQFQLDSSHASSPRERNGEHGVRTQH